MANLTETAYQTRRTIAIFAIFVIGFFVLRTSINTAKEIWLKFKPPAPNPPSVAFGKLPKIKFPEEERPKNLALKLETIEGGFPSFPEIGKVYFIPKRVIGLLDLDRARQKAAALGFSSEAEEISETVYRWKTKTSPEKVLEMDIVSNNFTIRYPYENDTTLVGSRSHPDGRQSVASAKAYLASASLLAPDLEKGNGEFIYFRFVPPGLLPTPYQYESDFVRVNLFRADLDDLKIFPPHPKDSLISFLFTNSPDPNKQIVKVNYTHYPIEAKNPATYPLKPAEQAWQELQNGEGFIANMGENQEGIIRIRKASLAYFDSGEAQDFLQPIYVFEGDNEFMAYTAAIDPEWQQ